MPQKLLASSSLALALLTWAFPGLAQGQEQAVAGNSSGGVVTYSGYLVDFYCYRLGVAGSLALDGTDIIKRPWTHTLHCLRDPPQCYNSGFYVAINDGPAAGPNVGDGNYVPKYMLDKPSSDKALALLRTYPKGHARDNVEGHFLVTVTGTVDVVGVMTATSITECTGDECDGKCVGECGVKFSGDGLLGVPAMLWLHMFCMVSSWGFLLPLGVICAHFLRGSERKVMGVPVWFWGHRTFQMVGWIVQLVGFAAIIAHKGVGHHIKHFKAPHEIIGLTVVIIGTLQPLNAQLRHLPCVGHPDENGNRTTARKLWEYLHKGLGYVAVILGVANVGLGIYYAWVLSFGDGLVPTVGALASIFFVFYVSFACLARCKGGKKEEVVKVV